MGNFDFIDTTKKGILCVNSETDVHLPGMVKYYCVGVLGIRYCCELWEILILLIRQKGDIMRKFRNERAFARNG